MQTRHRRNRPVQGSPSITFMFSPASLTGVACRATFSGTTGVGLTLPLWLPIAHYLSTLEFVLSRHSPDSKGAIVSFVPVAPALKFMSSEISLADSELPDWVNRAPWRLSWSPAFGGGVHRLQFGREETEGHYWHEIGDSPTGLPLLKLAGSLKFLNELDASQSHLRHRGRRSASGTIDMFIL